MHRTVSLCIFSNPGINPGITGHAVLPHLFVAVSVLTQSRNPEIAKTGRDCIP